MKPVDESKKKKSSKRQRNSKNNSLSKIKNNQQILAVSLPESATKQIAPWQNVQTLVLELLLYITYYCITLYVKYSIFESVLVSNIKTGVMLNVCLYFYFPSH